jgi:hypothetical protein
LPTTRSQAPRLQRCCRLGSAPPPPPLPPPSGWELLLQPQAVAGFGMKVLAAVAVPYLGVLAALVTFQRSLIFPRPSQLARDDDLASHGMQLLKIPAAHTTHHTEGDTGEIGTVLAALHSPARKGSGGRRPETLVYFHGNADQIGWGGAYMAKLLRQQHKITGSSYGLLAVEYPGYGHASGHGGAPSEPALYEAAEQVLRHAVKPTREGGLGLRRERLVLFGQSIGCAVALEMAARGWGAKRGLVLLSPFASLPAMVDAAFPIAAPALRVAPWVLLDRFDNLGKARVSSSALHSLRSDA